MSLQTPDLQSRLKSRRKIQLLNAASGSCMSLALVQDRCWTEQRGARELAEATFWRWLHGPNDPSSTCQEIAAQQQGAACGMARTRFPYRQFGANVPRISRVAVAKSPCFSVHRFRTGCNLL